MPLNRYLPLLLSAFGLLSACSEDLTMEEVTETEISSGGGSALSFDGMFEARFGPGAVQQSARITIRTLPSGGTELLSAIYEIGPRSLTLQQPIQIRFRTMQSGQVARIEEGGPRTRVPSSTESGEVVADITALGSYALTSLPPDAGVADAGMNRPDAMTPGADAGAQDGSVLDTGVRSDSGFNLDAGPADSGFVNRDGGQGPGDAGSILDAGLGLDAGVTPPPTLATCGVNEINEVEPNDTRATAMSPVQVNAKSPFRGTFSSTTDVDWYSFISRSTTSHVTVSTHTVLGNPVACAGLDTILTITDASGTVLGTNDDSNGTTCSQLTLTSVPRASTLYIQVTSRGPVSAPYFVTLVDDSANSTFLPDLAFGFFGVARSVWQRGGSYPVLLCTENLGIANLPSTTTGIYLSTNNLIRLTDLLVSDVTVPPLGAGGVIVQSVPIQVPASIPAPSSFFIGALADRLNEAREIRESNNVSTVIPLSITP